ncbi:class I SAM-dependent methyltransferase [Rheinheimera muenzenbergensis]|uniref:Class I SAM-dependent methyltransferase n=1 Tax=Rheinheimera muenzenbergensis TaxID=1193628 RepID=A0ABU8C7N9_9GAMM
MKPALSEKDHIVPSGWRQFRQGDALSAAIVAQLAPWWQQIFGYYLLKVGDLSCEIDTSASKVQQHIAIGNQSPAAMLRAQPDALPVSGNSVDAVLLSHCLEFSADPHHVVREAHRVLLSDGYLLLTGVNPYSAVGLMKAWPPCRSRYPWQGRFFSASRVIDWLHLVGFEVLAEQRFFCSALLAEQHDNSRYQHWLERYLSFVGSSYLLVARKRELPLTPVRPKWQPEPAFAQSVKGVSARQGAVNTDSGSC